MNLLRCFIYIVSLGLTACAFVQPHVVTPETNQCKMRCLQQLHSCKQRCNDSCSICLVNSMESSASHYFNYTNEKQVEGGYINRRLKSYRDPLQCRKVSCSCMADLSTCNQACTGVIEKRLQSLPYCP